MGIVSINIFDSYAVSKSVLYAFNDLDTLYMLLASIENIQLPIN